MSFQKLKDTVLDRGLCTCCGACELVCPEELLTRGIQEPLVVDGRELSCGDCTLCTDVCPGLCTDVGRSERLLFGRTRDSHERWLGVVSHSLFAQATDPEIYERSSSGGSTTAVLLAAQRELDIDYLVVSGRDPERPWLARSQVCKGREDLVGATQQSTYQLFPHLRVLKEMMRKVPNARIAIVALPCQVQALRKLQRLDGPVSEYARDQIILILEIACSSSTLSLATEKIIRDLLKVPLNEVKDVRYRDGAYPGDFVVYLKNGEKRVLEFWKSVEIFKACKTHRCMSCGDWMSGLADVSFCDGDPNIFMSSAVPDERVPKHGRVMVRTLLGNRVVNRAISDGAITVVPGLIERMNLGLERKRNRRAHYEQSRHHIPDPPIPDYREECEIISDHYLLQVSKVAQSNQQGGVMP